MRAEWFAVFRGSSMSYGADFANADPANAPLDPTIFIGAEPTFWAAVLLGLVAAALAGYFFGKRAGENHADAAQAIWKAVDSAARSAMGADDNALKGRAVALRKVIEARLGKTLKLIGGVSDPIKDLDDAIDGHGPGHSGTHGPEHDPSDGDHGRNGGQDAPAPSGGGGGGGGAATANITIVTGAAPEQTHSTGGAHKHAHDPHKRRDLNQRDQTNALRLAVAAFNQHWRDESLRVGELRAAHAELSNPGSRPDPAHPARGKVHGTRAAH